MKNFSEDSRVKIPALLHLTRLGYTYLSLKNATWDESTNIFTDIFRESIARINPEADPDEIARAAQEISIMLDNEDLGRGFFERMTRTTGLKLVDFEDFDNNSFHVVTELAYRNGDEEFRPDITLLINGLPLVFMEVKKPNNRDGILAERTRINRRLRNTILHPYHRDERGALRKFNFIVSNPPFKLDFSDYRDELDTPANRERFFAGIPKVPNKDKDKMAIYLLFIQHIIHTLAKDGKAAIVVPTGFITAQSGIERKIREHLVAKQMLAGVVSMPSNIFATTGTNVSILFLDATNREKIVLIDASNLGTKVKAGKNQKTLLSAAEEDQIIRIFNAREAVEDFSVVVSYEEIAAKNHSLSAGQYFDVKVEHVEMTPKEFEKELAARTGRLKSLFGEARKLDLQVEKQLATLTASPAEGRDRSPQRSGE